MQSLTKNISEAPKIFLAIVLATAIVLFGFGIKIAGAHEDPVGCFSSGVNLSITVFRADGTTPVGGGTVTIGETIKYSATLSHAGGSNCNYEGGDLDIITPDGVNHDVDGGLIPLINGTSFTGTVVSYVVSAPDIGGDSDLDASAIYSGGTSHLGANNVSPVGATAPAATPVSGTIIVVKNTVPDDGIDFAFTTNTLPGGAFSLEDDGDNADELSNTKTFSGLTPGVFDVAETANSSYTTTSSCSDDSPIGAINVAAGETVTCTFTNTLKQGHIIVNKVTNPSGDTQSFSFDATGTGYNDFALTDVADPNDQTLNAGAYSVSETLPSGWTQTSATCVSTNQQDVETPASISLQANETVTCTFTNTKKGHIIVDKVTSPSGSSQSFSFTATGAGYSNFALTDAAAPNNQEVVPGAYTVSEGVVAGWDSNGGVCDNGETPASLDVGAGETVTCTFTNTEQQGHIIVNKVTNPSGDAQSFNFDATGAGYNDFALTDLAAPNDQTLAAGTYSVSETVPSGWTQTSAVCDMGETIDSIDVGPGETVTCTFTNTKDPEKGRIIIVKQTNPDGDLQSFEFNPSWSETNFSLQDNGQYDSGQVLDAGTYSVAEINIPANWAQTSATCSDSSAVNNIQLAAGETVTCTFTNTYTPPAVQGCSPGYWKQSQHYGSYPAGIYPNTLFSTVFGGTAFPGKTLLEVLSTGGGGQIALGRIMVGAYLNASTVAGFPYTPAQVIAAFNGATEATYGSVKSQFEALQDPCPFGNNPGPAGPGLPISDKPGKSKNN